MQYISTLKVSEQCVVILFIFSFILYTVKKFPFLLQEYYVTVYIYIPGSQLANKLLLVELKVGEGRGWGGVVVAYTQTHLKHVSDYRADRTMVLRDQ